MCKDEYMPPIRPNCLGPTCHHGLAVPTILLLPSAVIGQVDRRDFQPNKTGSEVNRLKILATLSAQILEPNLSGSGFAAILPPFFHPWDILRQIPKTQQRHASGAFAIALKCLCRQGFAAMELLKNAERMDYLKPLFSIATLSFHFSDGFCNLQEHSSQPTCYLRHSMTKSEKYQLRMFEQAGACKIPTLRSALTDIQSSIHNLNHKTQ
jgi:hypothetical protein